LSPNIITFWDSLEGKRAECGEGAGALLELNLRKLDELLRGTVQLAIARRTVVFTGDTGNPLMMPWGATGAVGDFEEISFDRLLGMVC
jgi:hypothetical protein